MSFDLTDYLRHILAEMEYLLAESAEITQDEFMLDETRKRAFVRSLEIIGEAVKNLPDEFRDGYPDVDWKAMAGMRDRLIHAYFGVDYEIVWNVIQGRVPVLRERIAVIINS